MIKINNIITEIIDSGKMGTYRSSLFKSVKKQTPQRICDQVLSCRGEEMNTITRLVAFFKELFYETE